MYQKGDGVTVKHIRDGHKQPTIEPGTVETVGKAGDLTIKLDIGEIARRRQTAPDLRRTIDKGSTTVDPPYK